MKKFKVFSIIAGFLLIPALLFGATGWDTWRQFLAKAHTWTGAQTFSNINVTGGSVTGITDLVVADGGTGVGTLTDNGMIYGNGTAAVGSLAEASDGQIPIGDTGGPPILATLTGTANEIDVTNAAGSITIGLVNPLAVSKGGTGTTGNVSGLDFSTPPIIGKTTPAELWGSPNVSKGPAIINSGFAGTISSEGEASSTTLNFSSAADAILAGYSATNPVLGTTLIVAGPYTRYIVSWTDADTCVVNSVVTLALSTAITSVQLPITTFVNSAGVTQGWMNAAGAIQGTGTIYGSVADNGDITIEGTSSVTKTTSFVILQPTGGFVGIGKTSADYLLDAYGTNPRFQFTNSTTRASGTSSGYRAVDGAGQFIGEFVFSNLSAANNSSKFTVNVGNGSGGTVEPLSVNYLGNFEINGAIAGSSAVKVIAMGEATAPTTSSANGAQLWPENLDANGGNNRFWTRTEDGVHSPLAIKSETDAQANPKAPSQGVNMTYAASDSSGITVADNDNIDFGTGNFTLVWRGSLPDWTPAAYLSLFNKYTAATGYSLQTANDSSGKIRLYLQNVEYLSTVGNTLVDGTVAEVTTVITNGTSVVFYINGVQLGASVAIASKTASSVLDLSILGEGAARYAGTVHHALTFNRALSAAEVLDLYRNGVSFADKWGSQTDNYDSNFSVDNDSWDDATGNPETTYTGNIDGIAGVDDVLRCASSGAGGVFQMYGNAGLTAGNKYTITFDYYADVGTGLLYLGSGYSGTKQNSGNNIAVVEGSWQTNQTLIVDNLVQLTYKISQFDTIDGFTNSQIMASGTNIYFKNIKYRQPGATLALEPEGIQADKWYDSSSNALDASYPTVGWTATRLLDKKRIKQPTPTAETTAVTLTIAKLLTGIITATHTVGATQAYTLPTGALCDAWPAFRINDYFDWVLINLSAAAADTVTVTAAATGHTIVGNPIVQAAHSTTGGVWGNSAGFRTVKTAAATFISYRIN